MTPQRTCVGCRAHLTPEEGVRVSRAADGSLVVGRSLPGRGAWLCRGTATSCAAAATKRRAWSRALRAEVAAAAVERLQQGLAADSGGVGATAPDR